MINQKSLVVKELKTQHLSKKVVIQALITQKQILIAKLKNAVNQKQKVVALKKMLKI